MQQWAFSAIFFHLNSIPKPFNSHSSSQINFFINNFLQYQGGFGNITYLGVTVQKNMNHLFDLLCKPTKMS